MIRISSALGRCAAPAQLLCSILLAVLLAMAPTSSAQGTASPGLSTAPAFTVSPTASVRTLANGDSIVFDGTDVRRVDAAGATLATLLTFTPSVFPAFVAIAPDQATAYVGESSGSDVWTVPLDGSAAPSVLTNLVFSYDACFDPNGDLIVSAATCGFSCGNDIVRVDLPSGATTQLAHVSGASGPVAMDALGNLYYGEQAGFAPLPGSLRVLLFTAAALAGPLPLSDAHALTWSTGWDGASSLLIDPATHRLYLSENNSVTGAAAVWEMLGSSKSSSRKLYQGAPGPFSGGLDLHGVQPRAQFLPYQPAAGGELVLSETDFFANQTVRVGIQPARPTAVLSGPGASGAGAFSWSIDGGAPNGWVLAAIGLSSTYDPLESAVLIPGVAPLFTGLELATTQFVPVFLRLDAQGSLAYAGHNPGGFTGVIAAQGIVYGPGFQILGTTNAVLF
jgi:hypothetical protein